MVWSESNESHRSRRNDTNAAMNEMEEAIQHVPVLVRHRMTSFKTFSLVVDPEPKALDSPFYCYFHATFSDRFGPSLIESLPNTSVNPEIDTGGAVIDRYCKSLHRLILRLTYYVSANSHSLALLKINFGP